jgi:hypothetical protein
MRDEEKGVVEMPVVEKQVCIDVVRGYGIVIHSTIINPPILPESIHHNLM